ncbi:hypothetical protein OsI_02226 [Oryza sativa Indica Group]|uniref:Uncharacterized protein n=1 Tax=Oryza sativa subsp. indica TaxID=39946 RepID=B8A9A6_ORYSI|nr:hypothetical protein OsI_02226 [Oryza sativa Indica Group]
MAVPPKNDAEAFDQPDPNDERLPEEKLNTMAVRIAFFYRVMNGCGALAFAWATVVLLGGYATLIKQKDFWFVTIIVFMEATWLHGTDQDRLPSRASNVLRKVRIQSAGFVRKHNENTLSCLPPAAAAPLPLQTCPQRKMGRRRLNTTYIRGDSSEAQLSWRPMVAYAGGKASGHSADGSAYRRLSSGPLPNACGYFVAATCWVFVGFAMAGSVSYGVLPREPSDGLDGG